MFRHDGNDREFAYGQRRADCKRRPQAQAGHYGACGSAPDEYWKAMLQASAKSERVCEEDGMQLWCPAM